MREGSVALLLRGFRERIKIDLFGGLLAARLPWLAALFGRARHAKGLGIHDAEHLAAAGEAQRVRPRVARAVEAEVGERDLLVDVEPGDELHQLRLSRDGHEGLVDGPDAVELLAEGERVDRIEGPPLAVLVVELGSEAPARQAD